jgi:acetyltransferase-like isoleucine patch superfamily enzyme
MTVSGRARLFVLAVLALCPNWLKQRAYRLFFGYRIGRGVRIGITLLDARSCQIDDDVSIGHLNVFVGVEDLVIGDHARIGHLNVIRGGQHVRLGKYSEMLRLNQINSMPDPHAELRDPRREPKFFLGDGSVVTTGHKIDFTDRVDIGDRTVIGGRNSSLWTHNRQRTAPITIGSKTYVGSEIRMAPGATIPSHAIVGMGAVVVDELAEENSLFAGVPARRVKDLDDEQRFLIERKTRLDLPDEL